MNIFDKIIKESATEFIIHVQDEYDYEIISEDRELILKLIFEAYQEAAGGSELPVFGVNG